jgi:hypothetical protein
MMMDIILNPRCGLDDLELRSDEAVVMLDGQPFRIPAKLAEHLGALVETLVFAKSS